ncbi:NLR family CARD domain-containing protein 3-like isoform X2 [Acropora millepora]|uniref:NLR family CARD domain-containing protein 3-like isoform X2 n=1 Tax=Acropora millepora TaxID=45264 RepID=UPI001CF39EB4|nr:NLR family CARD domain-containing protein 3-like isoform X2 [Acropora millepora]
MASFSRQPQQHDRTIKVTILASEWGSSKGGLSTINKELAIQLAKFPDVEVTFFLPKCSHESKKEAQHYGISIVEAERRPGYEELEWLSFPPKRLKMDVVVGHGLKLGKQAQVIRNSHKCKWVQVVHTDPEKLGMFKCYENPISKGEQKHSVEVELCQMADLVVGVGPKLAEAFRKYLRWCKKDQDVFEFTPGVFADFASAEQALDERKDRSVLVFGRGDDEDFKLKGFDIAVRSVTALPDTHLVFVGAPEGKHTDVKKRLLESGISESRLTVRGFKDREALKREFCEADLVLMPSRTEGFGLTALEAMSAGLPVLVCKNSGFGEALGHVPSGSSFVIDSEDCSAWTEAIKGTWNKDRGTRLDEIKVLCDAYGKKYSWSEQCKNLIDKMVSLLVNRQDTFGRGQISAQEGVERRSTSTEDRAASPDKDQDPQGGIKRKRKKCSDQDKAGYSDKDEDIQGGVKRKIKKCSDQGKPGDPSHVIKWIQQIYAKREGVILPVPWCDRFSFQLENIFTRLRIVAKEKTREKVTKEVTSMSSIFTPHEDCQQPLVVLIEGEPGIGKTTYCQKLAYDWATRQGREWEESFPIVEVLLLLRCREIESSNIWQAIDDQVLPEVIEPEERDTFIQFLRENPSKVLLVLDGLDEADPEKLELFRKLIQKELLPGCFIVLTSRHEAGSNIKPFTDTLLEIVGFTTTDAECFIRRYFQQSDNHHFTARLIAKLGAENLNELTRNPLNTLLLCVIFEDLKGVLPNSRTELYIEMVRLVLRRYENKNGLSSSDKDLLLVYKEELMILGRMALDSLHKGELYFEDHQGDFKQRLLARFGFVSIQAGGSKRAPCPRYAFFHKSFQEFFSAFFLAFSMIDGTMDYKSVAEREYERELREVFRFMAGIVAMHSEEIAESIVESFASVVNLLYPRDYQTPLSLALLFIDECKLSSETMFTKLAHSFGKSLDLVELDLPDLYYVRVLLSPLYLALRVNTSLTSLDLSQNSIGVEGASSLSQTLRVNTSLTSLCLYWNSIGDDGASSLSEALRVNTSLTSLDLYGNSIGDEGASSLSGALRVNTSLTSLNLGQNSIGDEGASSVSEALRVNTSLTSLNLSENSIGVEGGSSLSEALRVNTSLTSLYLCVNSIGVEGASSFSETLRVNTSLTSLDLTGNSIGVEGASSLSEALRVNTSLTSLYLARNSIGVEGASSLSEALRVNTSLTSLHLGSNSIGDEGASSLSEALRVNTSLTSLDLLVNSIGVEGASSLSQTLRVNTSLTSLRLYWNSIGDDGASSLSEALRVNTSLTSLNLGRNSIGDEGASSVSEALRVNTSLTSLNLSENSIGVEGGSSLSEALRVNTSLTSLNLCYNSIGDEGASSLFEALKVNTALPSVNY